MIVIKKTLLIEYEVCILILMNENLILKMLQVSSKEENKHKLKRKNIKDSCRLAIDTYNEIMNRTLRFNPSDPRPLRMLYLDMQMHLLRPSVIVEYERSAFVYDTGNIRITFDRNISYS